MAAQQLVSDMAQIEAEEGDLIQVEVDPVLLLSDKQLEAEVAKLPPEEKTNLMIFLALLKIGMLKPANMNQWTMS